MTKEMNLKCNQSAGTFGGARAALGVVASAAALLLACAGTAPAADTASAQGTGGHLKQDAKEAGAAIKEGAHRVGVAAKAVAHEVATAAKRSAAETRQAMRGEKVDAGASKPSH